MGAFGEGERGVAAADAALDQAVVGALGMHGRRLRGLGGGGVGEGGERRPGDREAGEVGARVLEGDEGDGLAGEAGLGLGERRLVGEARDDAEAVAAGDVVGGEDGGDARAGGGPGAQVAEGEGGARVGRADRPEGEGAGWCRVGAEALAAVDLGAAVEAGQAGADRGAGGG